MKKTIAVSVDEDTLKKVRLALANPATGNVQYGAMSTLINSLLIQWALNRLKNKPSEQDKEA